MSIRPLAVVAALILIGTVSFGQESRPTAATDPYTLDSCPVSGKRLGSMGDPVVKVISGREVRFCCAGCVSTFEKDSAKQFKKLDAKLAAEQRRYYPSSKCLISNEKIAPGEAIEVFVGNRLVRLCCGGCEAKLTAKPKKYLARIDKAARKAQRRAYPLKTCLVSGGKLGSMGKPHELFLGGRLIKLCCKGCVGKLHKNPAKFLAKLDAAWAKKGFPGVVKAAKHGDQKGHGKQGDQKGHGKDGDHGKHDDQKGHDKHKKAEKGHDHGH